MKSSALSLVKKQGRLLLDENTVQFAENCRLTFMTAQKDPASPVIVKTEPWEGCGVYTWCSRMLSVEGRYRLYYMAYDKTVNHYRTGIAESEDGLNWTKPACAKREFGGQTVDVSLETVGGTDACWPWRTVVWDPRPQCPQDSRFKSFNSYYDGGKVYLSGDGRVWRPHENNPVWNGASDIVHMMWDDKTGMFLAYYKLWRVVGTSADAPHKKIDLLCTTFNEKTLPDGVTELTCVRVIHVENGPDVIRNETFRLLSGDLSSDDGGGGHLSGKWFSRRVVCRAESPDFIHWKNGRVVLETDDRDRPSANIQIAQVFTMGGYYIAFLTVHDQRGFFEQQLAFSSDGINFSRPWRGNLISRGAPGEFDSGMVTQPVDPIVLGNQMVIYYGGTAAGHADAVAPMAIGRALMRREGFACRRAWDSPARLRTAALEVTEKYLGVNANAEGGTVTAALYTSEGTPIEGCAHEDCQVFSQDSAAFEDCFHIFSWNGKKELPAAPGEKLIVELRFKNADIYSILI